MRSGTAGIYSTYKTFMLYETRQFASHLFLNSDGIFISLIIEFNK